MPERQQLDYDSQSLATHLKQSTGKGVEALFPSPSSSLPAPSPTQTRPTPSKTHHRKRKPQSPGNVQERDGGATPHSPDRARKQTSTHAHVAQELRKGFLNRHHLSSCTFRFKARELDELDRATAKVNQTASQKVSKNDLVRLALNWLLQDYQTNHDRSMLAGVLADV